MIVVLLAAWVGGSFLFLALLFVAYFVELAWPNWHAWLFGARREVFDWAAFDEERAEWERIKGLP